VRYPWPGNVRELENVIYEAMVLSDDPVLAERSLPLRFRTGPAVPAGPPASGTPGDTLRGAAQSAAGSAEKVLIEKALRDSGGNRTLAARALSISRKTLFNKIKALGLRG
jgi:DNA-binding NtrC family response regulator